VSTCVTLYCRFESIRSIVRFVFGKHGKANVLLLPAGLPRVLSRVVDSDLDADNRVCAMNCLVNISAKYLSLVLVGNEIIACALRVVQEQGTGAAPPHPPPPRLPNPQPYPLSHPAAYCFDPHICFTFASPSMQI
jgi:hypothetical protein